MVSSDTGVIVYEAYKAGARSARWRPQPSEVACAPLTLRTSRAPRCGLTCSDRDDLRGSRSRGRNSARSRP